MLRVTSIDERVTARMIFNVFNRFGHLEAILYRKKLRYALLQFEDVDNATVAKEILNNCLFFGGNVEPLLNICSCEFISILRSLCSQPPLMMSSC